MAGSALMFLQPETIHIIYKASYEFSQKWGLVQRIAKERNKKFVLSHVESDSWLSCGATVVQRPSKNILMTKWRHREIFYSSPGLEQLGGHFSGHC